MSKEENKEVEDLTVNKGVGNEEEAYQEYLKSMQGGNK